ncbi:hypothetical protein DBV15_04110 [Temnothorax longispinosus]|uniref:Uncharacterized protein n=1 Tax=Temnothorax longispinosus TaxID=300112 RepID=A0A4S2KC81_9HYME|nr:hypothetical protein DBV15_04110 [Temnothorax longispinosus]
MVAINYMEVHLQRIKCIKSGCFRCKNLTDVLSEQYRIRSFQDRPSKQGGSSESRLYTRLDSEAGYAQLTSVDQTPLPHYREERGLISQELYSRSSRASFAAGIASTRKIANAVTLADGGPVNAQTRYLPVHA